MVSTTLPVEMIGGPFDGWQTHITLVDGFLPSTVTLTEREGSRVQYVIAVREPLMSMDARRRLYRVVQS